VIERLIKIYTEKFSRFSKSKFAVVDGNGKLIARTGEFEDFESGIKVELMSNYGTMFLYVKPSENAQMEVELLKFLYTELLNYEGYIEQLVKELANRQEELGIVYDIIARASLVFDEVEIAKIIMEKINSILSPKACIIGIFEGDALNQKYASGVVDEDMKFEAERLIDKAIKQRNFVILLRKMAVPMLSGEKPIGGIFVCSDKTEFDTTDAKLLLTLGNYAGIILYRNRLIEEIKRAEVVRHEIELAKRIQENLLPKFIPRFEGLDIFALIKPSSVIGGDYYDFITDKGRRIFLIADVSGHGISSALLLSSLRSIVKLMYEFSKSTGDFLSLINDVIYKDTSEIGMYSTIFVGDYNPTEGTVTYSNAGHVPPLFFRRKNNEIFELEVHGAPVGLFEGENYEVNQISLSTGDIILAFTDGLTELRNESGEFFGIENLKKLIFDTRDKSAMEICNTIYESALKFKGNAEQKDDITLLVIKKV
jgi:serine phosphatase RsbU (regulator of sigma subunit)